jgi:hypothetical protein
MKMMLLQLTDDSVGKLIEPPPVPFSFGAPGWYALGAFAILLLAFCVYLLVLHYRSNLYRRHALAFLTDTEIKYSAKDAFGELVYETHMLIKRIAMSRYGRKKVSSLRGDEWIAFINTTWHDKAFDNADDELLTQTIYKPRVPVSAGQATAFTRKARRWIKKHKKHIKA